MKKNQTFVWVKNGICVGCEDGFHDRCLDGQMNNAQTGAIECDCATHGHEEKKS